MPKTIKNCTVCKKEFTTYKQKQQSCSQKCNGIRTKGENNPNLGNTWTREQKQKQSKLIKSKVDNDYREKAGSANRGKKFSSERIVKMHEMRSRESYSHPHTEETKRIIGLKSKEKFKNLEYQNRMRSIMTERGYWISEKDKSDWELYRFESHWKKPMIEFLTEDEIKILNSEGMYHNIKNKKGYVRDHMFSKKSGFDLKVFPELLRHPANLQLLSHSENSKKARTYILGNDWVISFNIGPLNQFEIFSKEN